MKTIFAGLVVLGSATSVVAGGTFDSTGSVKGQAASEITVLSEDHMVMLLPAKHTAFDMATPDHPFADMTGSCTGATEVIGAAVSGQGMCVYENSKGEKLAIRWLANTFDAEGKFHGTWIIEGGTGSMAGASGGGDFISNTDVTSGAQDVALTGAISLR